MTAPDLYGIDPDCLYPWRPSEDADAPTIFLSPLTLKLSNKIDAANQKRSILTARLTREATDKAAKEGVELDKEKLTGDLLEAWDSCYSEDLQEEILAHAVTGWEGLKRPGGKVIEFKGNLAALPSVMRANIFWAIVTGAAWTVEAREGFGSRPASLSE